MGTHGKFLNQPTAEFFFVVQLAHFAKGTREEASYLKNRKMVTKVSSLFQNQAFVDICGLYIYVRNNS
jgi:hypothetical protein